MRTHALAVGLVLLFAPALAAQTTITAIFGSGNPNGGWTASSGGEIQLALRAKGRNDTGAAGTTPNNGAGTYSFPVFQGARGPFNYEFSINSDTNDANGVDRLTAYDFYLSVDGDPDQCVDYTTVDPLAYWADNSYGNNSTLNGQGVEGPAAALAGSNNIAQNSQNITFGDYPAGAFPAPGPANATYSYELYAVADGAGPGGARLASVTITVVVGAGGAVCTDTDGDGVVDDVDHCVPSVLGGFVDAGSGPTSIENDDVDANGCSIQDLVNECAAGAKNHGAYVSCIAQLANDLRKAGTITNKQSTELKNGAAKSSVGK
jgi:hypothetical protein